MKAQFTNLVMSSLALWMNNTLLEKGEAFVNHHSYFYPIGRTISGYHTYAAPFNQFVSDLSVTGATVLTGVYLDSSFITTGQSGLTDINYEKGHVYFTTEITGLNRISGSFAVKDFNVVLTSEPEEKLLFETRYPIRPKMGRTITGLLNNELTYPVVFLKEKGGDNEPLAFGGMDNTIVYVTAVVLADSAFALDAATSILKDKVRTYVPLFSADEMPYNMMGGFKNGNFNYTGVTANKIANDSGVFINKVSVSKLNVRSTTDVKLLNPEAYFALVDLELHKPRYPRA